ncbi:Lectin receptor kinase [Thalictrum thalictroides]|uniref:Lectin receptor kinase n=1 Tax=Thalictrum thalictroides TaxID=46969 RepID=A0A7J6WEB4_THATH|nr:Lectin receptor kinase [Thalictrum thalictroides]
MALPQIFIKFLLIFLLIYLPFCQAQLTEIPRPYEYSVDKFNITLYDSLKTLGNAIIDEHGALQITSDSLNAESYRLNNAGRVMLKKSFKVWESQTSSLNNTNSSSDIVASFNSTFLANFFVPIGSQPGEGFAFVISPDLEIPPNSYGEWLGLTNATLNGNSANKFVAIEFDTKKQSYDINDNHIGLNIDGVHSKKNVSLLDFNITLAPLNLSDGIKYWVWIEYNGTTKLLEVYIVEEHKRKPALPVLSEYINLKDYVNQRSYFGFSASTGATAQLNCVLQWYLTVQNLDKDNNIWLKVGIALGAAVVVLLVICVLGWFYYRKNKKVSDELNILNELLKLPGTPKEFQYKDLKEATNNFNEKMKLGQGGYGVVYKGVLPKENTQVAVKRFSRESIKGIADFLAELKIIYRLRHKHLVPLLGWCHKDRTLLLVYEYMPNGSLDTHLFGSPDKYLSWAHRNNIISGLASALNYLHYEFDQMVVHRDLKSSNILLDSEYNARLGDFGLARALEQGKDSYATADGVPGTLGYIAPETFHAGKATRDSDVFGFGAVVLEVVCGTRPWTKVLGSMIVVDWVWKLYRENRILEAVDDKLGTNYVDVEAERLLLLGLACCHPIASERPKARNIVQIISGSVPVPEVPRFKPAFVWEPEDSTTSDTESTNTTDSTESGPQYLIREKYVGFVDIIIKP